MSGVVSALMGLLKNKKGLGNLNSLKINIGRTSLFLQFPLGKAKKKLVADMSLNINRGGETPCPQLSKK